MTTDQTHQALARILTAYVIACLLILALFTIFPADSSSEPAHQESAPVQTMPCPRDAYYSLAHLGLGEPPAGLSLDCITELPGDPGTNIRPTQFAIQSQTEASKFYLFQYKTLTNA